MIILCNSNNFSLSVLHTSSSPISVILPSIQSPKVKSLAFDKIRQPNLTRGSNLAGKYWRETWRDSRTASLCHVDFSASYGKLRAAGCMHLSKLERRRVGVGVEVEEHAVESEESITKAWYMVQYDTNTIMNATQHPPRRVSLMSKCC